MLSQKRVSERVASLRRGEKRKKEPERAKTNIDHHSEETEVSKARTAEPLVQHDDLTTLNENAKLGQGGDDREELGMSSVSGGLTLQVQLSVMKTVWVSICPKS